jgi:nucleotide-binding universal stress UspA family protein
MYAKIVVPLDGSELAEASLPYALELANRLNASLLLLRIAELTNLVSDTPDHELEVINRAETYLQGVKENINNPATKYFLPNDRVETVVGYGEAVHEIAEIAPFEKGDLIVMTTHGRTGVARMVVGSVAFRVLQHATLPVLIYKPAKPTEKLDIPTGNPINSIIITLDGTTEGETIIDPAIELAKAISVPVTLLGVIQPFIPIEYGEFASGVNVEPDRETEERRVHAIEYLSKVQTRLATQGVTVNSLVRVGNAADEILSYIQETGPAILAMATHARGKFGQILVGSVADEVMRSTHLPILMVKRGVPTKKAQNYVSNTTNKVGANTTNF